MIAALYVETAGIYFGRAGVDPWDLGRDARLYAGPHPVVAHPPCERWGRYWHGGPSCKIRKVKGADDGCFAAALAAVRKFGGVLEHPEASAAWAAFGLARPARGAGWQKADAYGGWTCCVEQGHFGHKARKATWLYAVGAELPALPLGPSAAKARLDIGYHSAEERRAARLRGVRSTNDVIERLSRKQRLATPPAFAELLIGMAESVNE